MRIYTAHLRPAHLPPGRGPVLVREGFSWGAFLFGPLWLACNGAWTAAGLALAALVLAGTTPFGPAAGFALFFVLGLFGNDLRRWSLRLGRFDLAHVVAGRSRDEAMLRLLSSRPDLRVALGRRGP